MFPFLCASGDSYAGHYTRVSSIPCLNLGASGLRIQGDFHFERLLDVAAAPEVFHFLPVMEGGASTGLLPHALFGSGPICRIKSPPFTSSE